MTSDARAGDDLDETQVPMRQQFGSGLKRKAVAFVPASANRDDSTSGLAQAGTSKSISDLYLSLVLPSDAKDTGSTQNAAEAAVCNICKLPVDGESATGKHEASIAHQVCMPHSHPPSALDRSRMGLNVLKAQGWDPDGRTGLGAEQQGMQHPLKTTPKDDNLGVGARIPKEFTSRKKEEDKVKKGDAKKCRKMAAEDRKRAARLRQAFYASSDVEKYLGSG